MPISAIVVNYNTGELLATCIERLLASEPPPRVLVIDNASTDDSARALAGRPGGQAGVEVLFSNENLGFARAVNLGIRQCGGDDVLVLNPDCLVEPATIGQLAAALAADARAALAAPLVTDHHGVPERASLRRFPDPRSAFLAVSGLHRLGRWIPALQGFTWSGEPWPDHTVQAEAVSGACMLIRRAVLAETGFFDEAYGLHCEDLDLMYRFHQAGWHCLLVPAARAVHHQGRSSRSRPLWVHCQKHLGMRRFYRKFQAPGHAWPMRLVVEAGIWLHFLALAPIALLRR